MKNKKIKKIKPDPTRMTNTPSLTSKIFKLKFWYIITFFRNVSNLFIAKSNLFDFSYRNTERKNRKTKKIKPDEMTNTSSFTSKFFELKFWYTITFFRNVSKLFVVDPNLFEFFISNTERKIEKPKNRKN